MPVKFGQSYRSSRLQRYSKSKNEWVYVEDMHPMHALNAILEMTRECGGGQNQREELLKNELFQALVERLQAVDEL